MTHAILRNLTRKNPEMVRGEGIYLYDSEGKRYIDGASGSALVCNIGHGVKEVAAVMTAQAAGWGERGPTSRLIIGRSSRTSLPSARAWAAAIFPWRPASLRTGS
jgi:hypothetical protein